MFLIWAGALGVEAGAASISCCYGVNRAPGAAGTVEDFAAARGNMAVRKLVDGTTEITVEDIVGHLPGSNQGRSGEASMAGGDGTADGR